MKNQTGNNVYGSARLTAIGRRLLRVGWLIVLVMAILSGVWRVNAAPPPPGYPPECPSCTDVLPVPFNLSVTLQRPNTPPPDPSWAVPVHLSLHPPGKPGIICWEWDLTLDQSGNWSGNLAICPGTYDARIKNPHTLRNVKYNVNIPAAGITLDMGTLLEGDASDDNWDKGNDFSILRATYWKRTGDAGFDDRADFDENGWINAADFSLLRTNYWQSGDIVVP